ncbi:MAG TPA: XRE family transcriptional regulator [Lachnospiraceae bacterium]|jgi:hypothetical protein|nr:XRE family transcriptional regulator [Lachnospiraceae bacterium]
MLKKPTEELMNCLNDSPSIENYIQNEQNFLIDFSISDFLNNLVSQKGIKKSQVIKNAEMNDIYGYQIFSGKRIPSRDKLIALAFGMTLSLDETQQLLKYAGFSPLYPKTKRDGIIIWGITHQLNICQTNENLYNQEERTL